MVVKNTDKGTTTGGGGHGGNSSSLFGKIIEGLKKGVTDPVNNVQFVTIKLLRDLLFKQVFSGSQISMFRELVIKHLSKSEDPDVVHFTEEFMGEI